MKISWTNGVFDQIHRGHLNLFQYCKTIGDILIVGINSDKYVKELKGLSRPINNQYDRYFHLKSLRMIDEVVVFDTEKELEQCIKRESPDYLVVGDEYRNKKVVGAKYAGEVVYFERLKGYSSTNIINKMNKIGIIFVDIDGTICLTNNSDYENSAPIFENIEKINKLHQNGNHIVYWTARGATSGKDWTELTKQQLLNWNCKHDELIMNQKSSYDLLIDDKSIRIEELI